MNTAILDRWRMAMRVSRPWYLGSMDDRHTAAERLYCRTLAVVVQDRVMAEERMPLAVPIWIPTGCEAEGFEDFV